MIGWLLLLAITAFFVYYGYHLLVKRGTGSIDADTLTTQCHLCRQSFPIREMVARDKDAGFVNYFCGECISKLYEDYSKMRMNR